jgi:IMP dehydrogenase/GMP reductase
MNIQEKCKSKFFKGWKGNSEWILEACEALLEAKEVLTKEAYEELEFSELDLETRTGQRLRKIASDDRLRDPAIKEKLPHSYAAMEQLSSLPDTKFYELVDSDLFHSDITRQTIEDFKKGVVVVKSKSVSAMRSQTQPVKNEENYTNSDTQKISDYLDAAPIKSQQGSKKS